jgi:hypothetical protein
LIRLTSDGNDENRKKIQIENGFSSIRFGKRRKMEIWDLMEMAFDFSRVDDVTFFASQMLRF